MLLYFKTHTLIGLCIHLTILCTAIYYANGEISLSNGSRLRASYPSNKGWPTLMSTFLLTERVHTGDQSQLSPKPMKDWHLQLSPRIIQNMFWRYLHHSSYIFFCCLWATYDLCFCYTPAFIHWYHGKWTWFGNSLLFVIGLPVRRKVQGNAESLSCSP